MNMQHTISPDELHGTVRELCAFGRKLPGSAEEEAACAAIGARLDRYGVPYEVHRFEAYISWPVRSAVTLDGAVLEATGVAFTADTGAAGVTGRLAELKAGRDLTGCVVLVDGLARYDACMAAAKAGAVGLIAISTGPQRHFVQASPIWGAPAGAEQVALLPPIPAVQVSHGDGAVLRARLGTEVHMLAETRREWRDVRMPVAEIAGREPHFVLLGAHYCTWQDGATDNLAGVALLLELARLYAKGEKPRYGIRFAFWTGHEQGGYAGSSWYADHARAALYDHAIAYLNVDIVGVRGATTKALRNVTGELADYAANVVESVAGKLPDEEEAFVRLALKRQDKYVDPRRSSRGSDQSFSGIGLSGAQVSSFLPAASAKHLPQSGLPWWWQTAQDTAERCDPAILAQDTLVYRHLVEGLVNAEALPFDYTATAADILASLREYAEAAPEAPGIVELTAQTRVFQHAAARLLQATPSAALNDTLLRIARHLNPVLHHAGSDFTYDLGRTTRLLPGLAPALRLASLPADEARMARVVLRRQANRALQALRLATREIETLLPENQTS